MGMMITCTFCCAGKMKRRCVPVCKRPAALYGRNTAHLRLEPFPVSLLKKILKDHSPRYANSDLLDLWAFTGYALERYFYWKFAEDTSYTRMGGRWDRKGENEIDLVCEDELAGRLDFFEVKRNPARFDQGRLKEKVAAFFRKHPDKERLAHEIKGVSMEEM